MQLHRRVALAHQGKNLMHQPARGIDIGWMPKACDKEDVVARGQTSAGIGPDFRVPVERDGHRMGAGPVLLQPRRNEGGFLIGRIQHHVRGRPHPELLLAHALHFFLQPGVGQHA